MFLIYKNRIISPSHTVNTYDIRQLLKIIHYLFLIRHIRFYVPSVRSNRNKPILPIWFQNIHIWQHWCRILRTKCDEVNHIRCQTISCHLPFIIFYNLRIPPYIDSFVMTATPVSVFVFVSVYCPSNACNIVCSQCCHWLIRHNDLGCCLRTTSNHHQSQANTTNHNWCFSHLYYLLCDI